MVVIQQHEMGWLRAVLGSSSGLVPGTWIAHTELRPAILTADVSPHDGLLAAEEGCVVGVLAWPSPLDEDCARVIKAYGFAYGSELPGQDSPSTPSTPMPPQQSPLATLWSNHLTKGCVLYVCLLG